MAFTPPVSSPKNMPGKVALIFGASGVSGWSFVSEILNDYPKPGVFSDVFALTNRPLSQAASGWPADSRLNIVSGIDLLAGSQVELEQSLQLSIPKIATVTHVYYLAYKASPDVQKELEEAVSMFKRSTIAVDKLCPELEFLVLQTGAKMYGCHLLDQRPSYMLPPLSETLPRMKPEDGGEMLFYHPQLDFLSSFAAEKSWNWCDTRPDIIVGFVPNQNFYSLGTVLGIYLSLYREVAGTDAFCPFPGTQRSWVALSNDSSAEMIARQTIHLSIHMPMKNKGMGFNVADAKNPETWETKWPQLCGYFGLKGIQPPESNAPEVRKFISENIDTWKRMEKEHGLVGNIADSEVTFKGFEYFLLTQFDFDRQYDMTRLYTEGGFVEERSVMGAWSRVFDKMRAAKIIP